MKGDSLCFGPRLYIPDFHRNRNLKEVFIDEAKAGAYIYSDTKQRSIYESVTSD